MTCSFSPLVLTGQALAATIRRNGIIEMLRSYLLEAKRASAPIPIRVCLVLRGFDWTGVIVVFVFVLWCVCVFAIDKRVAYRCQLAPSLFTFLSSHSQQLQPQPHSEHRPEPLLSVFIQLLLPPSYLLTNNYPTTFTFPFIRTTHSHSNGRPNYPNQVQTRHRTRLRRQLGWQRPQGQLQCRLHAHLPDRHIQAVLVHTDG